jgi:hypothetical protein
VVGCTKRYQSPQRSIILMSVSLVHSKLCDKCLKTNSDSRETPVRS